MAITHDLILFNLCGELVLHQAKKIANQRIKNAKLYDSQFNKIKEISLLETKKFKIVYHLYYFLLKKRNYQVLS